MCARSIGSDRGGSSGRSDSRTGCAARGVEGENEHGEMWTGTKHTPCGGEHFVDGRGGCVARVVRAIWVREGRDAGNVPRKPQSVEVYRCVTLRRNGSPKCTGAGCPRW